MRKDELLYLHQLLTAVRTECEGRGDVPADAFAAYEELAVSPVAAYEQKNEHERAVAALASTLAESAAGDADTANQNTQRSLTS
ncbi:UPF0058 family protein [Halorientalis brevis]|uniref:UPF0058 family protein n=1 Tax=Halorientalis brevis TaxID=1126241 RepID=A0ABD6CF48_9EURY|nr:UPF0058 family protein [Halorientalis brevis]